MTNFTYLKGNCPVCAGNRRDCRQLDDLFFCRADNPNPNFIFKKYDAHGFGIFVEKALQDEQDADRREEYRREREREKQQRLAEEASRRAKSLSEEERDQEIRKLLNQLSLNEKHRSDLKLRGLTDEAIRAGMFRSVESFQKLSEPVSSRLAGVNIDGRSLTHAQSGYICPVWNAEGLIVGWQLRLDDADEGGKYRWPSSRGKKRPNGPTAHLPTGELPLTFCRPQGKPKGIGLIEGTLKPDIAAHLSVYVMIGAAGGQFRVSQQQLKEGLEKLSTELETRQVILFPDAGSVSNWQVHRRDCDTIRLVQSWGYEVLVGDWGQFQDKSQPDYDELLASGGAIDCFIPAAEYLGLASADRSATDRILIECQQHDAARTKWEEAEALETEYELHEKVIQLFDNGRRKLGQRLNRVRRRFRGFGKPSPSEPPKTLHYVKGGLPYPEEYMELGMPRIFYRGGERIKIWKEAISKGWQHILDKSPPGCGKSFAAGNLDLRDFSEMGGIKRLFYIDNNHSNPSIPALEEWTNLEPRHNGLVEDPTKSTSTGRPWIRHPQPDDDESLITIEPNCPKAAIFIAAAEKNLPLLGGDNPVCMRCKYLEDCKKSGYKAQRKNALSEYMVRAHPQSMPRTTDFDYGESGNVWEEFDQTFIVKRKIKVSRPDFLQAFDDLERNQPAIYEKLKPLKTVLSRLFAGEIEVHKRYGLSAYEFLQMMPEKPAKTEEILEGIKATHSDLTQVIQGDSHDLARMVNSPVNWLLIFIEVWFGVERGSFAFKDDSLTLSIRDTHCQSLARSAAWNLYLDGTATRESLALKLGCQPEEILEIEQELPDFSNLNLIQIDMERHIDKRNRSAELVGRIDAMKKWIKAIHGENNVAVFDFKGQKREGTHFTDSRGSNAYQRYLALLSVGDPYTSLGDAADEWAALTGQIARLNIRDDEESLEPAQADFQQFFEAKAQAIIEQEIGRLRSHLRPSESLFFYHLGGIDLNYLRDRMPGVKLEKMTAFEFDPECGTAEQRTWRSLFHAYTRLKNQNPTQQELAAEAGISQGYLSKIAALFGGWKALKKLFLALLDSLYRSRNNLRNPTQGLPEWASKLFGLSDRKAQLALLATQARLAIKEGGKVDDLLADLDSENCQNLLDLLIRSLPPYLREAWQKLLEDCLDPIIEEGVV